MRAWVENMMMGTASLMAGAKFIGFDEGGHTWVGQHDEVMAEIVKLIVPPARP